MIDRSIPKEYSAKERSPSYDGHENKSATLNPHTARTLWSSVGARRQYADTHGAGQVAESRRRTYTPAHMANATIRWVIKDRLARGARPGFSGRRAVQVSQPTVDAWLRRVKTRYGIGSIICLLDENHLRLYSRIPGGLVSHYRTCGFKVEFIRVRNRRMLADAQLRKVWLAYKRLANAPVLVHCSAGRGRTGKAVTHIRRKLAAALRPSSHW